MKKFDEIQRLLITKYRKDIWSKFAKAISEYKMINENDKKLFYKEIDKLNNRDKKIMILRYGLYNNEEMTQKDVANLLGISQSYISRIEKKVIRRLRSVTKS